MFFCIEMNSSTVEQLDFLGRARTLAVISLTEKDGTRDSFRAKEFFQVFVRFFLKANGF